MSTFNSDEFRDGQSWKSTDPPLPSVEARRSGVPERETNSNSRSLQSALHASILRSTSNGGGGGVGIVIITCQLCVPAVPFPRTAPIRTS